MGGSALRPSAGIAILAALVWTFSAGAAAHAADLKAGQHTARLRLSSKSNPKSKGTAARILQFTVN